MMSFDDDVDEMKKQFLANRMEPEQIIAATHALQDKLSLEIRSDRLKFEYGIDDQEGPRVAVLYAKAPFHIGSLYIQGNGVIVFESESDYFPQVAASKNEEDFFKDAKEYLVEGLAAFELDEEHDTYEA